MAGAGYKLFNTGDVLTAAQVNTYLQGQVVMVFANAAARTTALSGVLAEGMVSYLKDTDALEIYSGAAWVGYGSGDITGVTAGTGISGGGTSGTVTITNSMATEITAAGDIIVGTGSGTFDNLPIGTTGQVLTADTTVSPYKVKWAAAAGATSLPAFRAYAGAATSCAASTWTKISFNTEVFDTDNKFASSRFTPTIAGYYIVTVENGFDVNALVDSSYLAIYKNGTAVAQEYDYNVKYPNMSLSSVLYLNTTDYIEVYMNQTYGTVNTNTGEVGSFFAACGIRS